VVDNKTGNEKTSGVSERIPPTEVAINGEKEAMTGGKSSIMEEFDLKTGNEDSNDSIIEESQTKNSEIAPKVDKKEVLKAVDNWWSAPSPKEEDPAPLKEETTETKENDPVKTEKIEGPVPIQQNEPVQPSSSGADFIKPVQNDKVLGSPAKIESLDDALDTEKPAIKDEPKVENITKSDNVNSDDVKGDDVKNVQVNLISSSGQESSPPDLNQDTDSSDTVPFDFDIKPKIQQQQGMFFHVLFLTASAANAVQGLTKSSTNNIPSFSKFYPFLYI